MGMFNSKSFKGVREIAGAAVCLVMPFVNRIGHVQCVGNIHMWMSICQNCPGF
jgi:hypothetical protein